MPVEVPTPELLKARFAEIQSLIEARAAGRNVKVVAVTKAFPFDYVQSALAAGFFDLGENYAQELVEKADEATDFFEPAGDGALPCWHFIGHLQSKQDQDAWSPGRAMANSRPSETRPRFSEPASGARILVQVNTTGEPQKAGCSPLEVPILVDAARTSGLKVEGLMTVGPTSGEDPRPAFELLRTLAENVEVEELSMGMSTDFEAAVEAGSTMVRIGSALFGPRTV